MRTQRQLRIEPQKAEDDPGPSRLLIQAGQTQRRRVFGKDMQVQRMGNRLRRACVRIEPREAHAQCDSCDHGSRSKVRAPDAGGQPVEEGITHRPLTAEANLSPDVILQIAWRQLSWTRSVFLQQLIEFTHLLPILTLENTKIPRDSWFPGENLLRKTARCAQSLGRLPPMEIK